MRVIHVAPTPFGSAGLFGGGERYPLELARALAPKVDCELLTFAPRASLDVAGPLKIRTLRSFGHLGGHPAHPIAPSLAAALSGADLIHTHHMRSLPSRLCALIASFRKQHVVVTDHGLVGGDWAGLLPKLFDRFLTVTEYSAQQLNVRRSDTRVIYGGADPTRFSPNSTETRRGVLFVGRLTPHKGVDRLIEALPEGAALRVAGSTGHDREPPESEYPGLLRRLARGHDVSFLGPVPDEELPSLYRQAQVLAIPSVHRTCYGKWVEVSELLGLVALEAMASGTPVIASRVGGLPEVIAHGETGFLVEPGDVDELRDHLSLVLGDASLAERLGQNARRLVLDNFTWEACADRCLRAYEELGKAAPDL
ncbi:MAG: glycosyltransferase family 4 protein [Actinomycetota bacterium]|nr:glycosyltransferase family 4 protein [Actinomycetota bacterium]